MMSNIIRFPLSLIPSKATLRVLRGPLRGKKWIAGSATHAHWAGTYETSRLEAFASAIQPGDCVYDIGANVGLYTLLASSMVGPAGTVYAFEPVTRNAYYLRRHLALNDVWNCEVIEAAVCDTDGMLRFSARGWHDAMGRLSADGELLVHSVSLDGCCFDATSFRLPNIIKIDVEGAEFLVLQGAKRILTESHAKLFIEIHGTQQHADCRQFLLDLGYHLEEADCYISAQK